MMLIFLFIFLAGITAVNAQSPADKVFEKYAGQDGFTTVNINKELFTMMMQMAPVDQKDTSMTEVKKMIEQLDGLKILTFGFDSTKIVKAVSVYNEFAGLFPATTYKELMTINEGRKSIKFLTKKEKDGRISEMVMLLKDRDEVAMMSLTGTIDLSTVAKMSKGMKIKGMENLQKMQHP